MKTVDASRLRIRRPVTRENFFSPPQASLKEIQGIPWTGPTRSFLLDCPAGFSHPRNPGISSTVSALIASGKEIFSGGGLGEGRIGFGVTRNLTRRRGKADGPPILLWRERRKGLPATAGVDFLQGIRLRPEPEASPKRRFGTKHFCVLGELISIAALVLSAAGPFAFAQKELPVIEAQPAFAPNVPPPVNRNYPARVIVRLEATEYR